MTWILFLASPAPREPAMNERSRVHAVVGGTVFPQNAREARRGGIARRSVGHAAPSPIRSGNQRIAEAFYL